MPDYAASALSLTPVTGSRRDVMSRISQYLTEHHEPYPPMPRDPRLLIVDANRHRILQIRPYSDPDPTLDRPADRREQWPSVTVELKFGIHTDFVQIRAREAPIAQTSVELWFPTAVHESVFGFDTQEREFAPEAKADLIRLSIGLSKELGAAGFAYRYADEDSLFGPPRMALLRDYVETGDRWLEHKTRLIVAGIAAPEIDPGKFEYDVEASPRHYRQSGYYLCDRLWPRS